MTFTLVNREQEANELLKYFETNEAPTGWITLAPTGFGKSSLSKICATNSDEFLFVFIEGGHGQSFEDFSFALSSRVFTPLGINTDEHKQKNRAASDNTIDFAAAAADAMFTGGAATAGRHAYNIAQSFFKSPRALPSEKKFFGALKNKGYKNVVLTISNMQKLPDAHIRLVVNLAAELKLNILGECTNQGEETYEISRLQEHFDERKIAIKVYQLQPLPWMHVKYILSERRSEDQLIKNIYKSINYNLFALIQQSKIDQHDGSLAPYQNENTAPIRRRLLNSAEATQLVLVSVVLYSGPVPRPILAQFASVKMKMRSVNFKEVLEYMIHDDFLKIDLSIQPPQISCAHDSLEKEVRSSQTLLKKKLLVAERWVNFLDQQYTRGDFALVRRMDVALKILQLSGMLADTSMFIRYVEELRRHAVNSEIRGSLVYVSTDIENVLHSVQNELFSNVFLKLMFLAFRSENFELGNILTAWLSDRTQSKIYFDCLCDIANEKFCDAERKSQFLLKEKPDFCENNDLLKFYCTYAYCISLHNLSRPKEAADIYNRLFKEFRSDTGLLGALLYRASVSFMPYSDTIQLLLDASARFDSLGYATEAMQCEVVLTTQLIRLGKLREAQSKVEDSLKSVPQGSRYYANTINHYLLIRIFSGEASQEICESFEVLLSSCGDAYSQYVITSNLFVVKNLIRGDNDLEVLERLKQIVYESPVKLNRLKGLIYYNLGKYYKVQDDLENASSCWEKIENLGLEDNHFWRVMLGKEAPSVDTQFLHQFDHMLAFLPFYEIPIVDHSVPISSNRLRKEV